MDPNLVLLIGGGLGVALLLVGVGVSLLGGQTVVEERLGRYAETGGLITATSASAEAKAERRTVVGDFFNRLGEGTNLFDSISKDLARADIKLRPAEFIGLIVISAIGVGF